MPIEKDLKEAYNILYEKKDPQKSLLIYERILQQDPKNLNAHVYKSVCLEKLYFGDSSWHNEETLNNAYLFLQKAMEIAQLRGDRSKLAFVNFRFSLHYYNAKQYEKAKAHIDKAAQLGYEDSTFILWKHNIDTKYKKWLAKHPDMNPTSRNAEASKSQSNDDLNSSGENSTVQAENKDYVSKSLNKFKTDWYQSQSNVTLVIFSEALPKSVSSVNVEADQCHLSICYPISENASEFQYSLTLSHEVKPTPVSVNLFPRKLEISFQKKVNAQWKNLKKIEDSSDTVISQFPKSKQTNSLSYPSSSKNSIDWSRIDFNSDDEENSNGDSADAFFQQLYKGADDDTKRAMMKSFIESNGTALNTNWTEVSKARVEPALPEGVEMKKY